MKRRVACVTPYLPAPASSGGVIRIVELARAASHEFELHLFCRGELWERVRLASSELNCFERIWMGRDYRPTIAPGIPKKVRRGSPRSLYRALRAAHQEAAFDAIVLEHCWGALGAFDLGIPTLLDEHNIESRYLEQWFAARGRAGKPIQAQVAALRLWERRAWREATQVCCVSEADASEMNKERILALRAPPVVVANGTTLPQGRPPGVLSRNGRVLFVGALHHPPNADAALRLVREIMPEVWKSRPDACLDLVGPEPPSALLKHAGARISVHGRVPSVDTYLRNNTVFACPLTEGAGSSLKTIEALAAGIPLVTTELGARGFGLVPDHHYIQAETAITTAAAIVAVLNSPERFQPLAEAGRGLAQAYDWSALGAKYTALLQRTINPTSARA